LLAQSALERRRRSTWVRLVIEPGGNFDGHCHMTSSSQSTKGVTIPLRAASQG
jgi:hypothetical protein